MYPLGYLELLSLMITYICENNKASGVMGKYYSDFPIFMDKSE
jgi:hypothetical protein